MVNSKQLNKTALIHCDDNDHNDDSINIVQVLDYDCTQEQYAQRIALTTDIDIVSDTTKHMYVNVAIHSLVTVHITY